MGEEFIASKERERKCGQQTTQKSHIVPTLGREFHDYHRSY